MNWSQERTGNWVLDVCSPDEDKSYAFDVFRYNDGWWAQLILPRHITAANDNGQQISGVCLADVMRRCEALIPSIREQHADGFYSDEDLYYDDEGFYDFDE